MNPYKEIEALRKGGNLAEAYQQAKKGLPEIYPDVPKHEEILFEDGTPLGVNIWMQRAMSWVLYEYLKQSLDDVGAFIKYLKEIVALNLPKEESLFFQNLPYPILKMIHKLPKDDSQAQTTLTEVFDIIKGLAFPKPEAAYSFLLAAFVKKADNWPYLWDFINWWDLSNLRPEDFKSEEYNGRSLPSTAEKAILAAAKALLGKHSNTNSTDDIQSFLPQLDKYIDKHPEFTYLPYYKAKLLMAMGDDENALNAFMPFARQKKNDFWVWQLLAEAQNDDQLKIACYCKALSIRTPQEFLVKLREQFASLLIQKKLYAEAKVEIQHIIKTKEANGWSIGFNILQWQRQEWYINAQSKGDNKDFYTQNSAHAEQLLYKDIPEETVVVEFVNTHKKMLNFIAPGRRRGFFKYQNMLPDPKIGDVLKVRFGSIQDDFHKVNTLRSSNEIASEELVKSFSGKIRQKDGNTFAFVEDVFIDPRTLQIHNLKDGQELSGKAILSFNKKKENWGWKVLSLA